MKKGPLLRNPIPVALLWLFAASLAEASASGETIFSDDFTGPDGAPLGAAWNQGNAASFEIIDDRADPLNSGPTVFGVDPAVARIDDPANFSIRTEFTVEGNGFAGIWFQGRDDASTGEQSLPSGYVVRFRPRDGSVQAANFLGGSDLNLSGWDNNHVSVDPGLYDAGEDLFGLTVASGGAPDEIDIVLENVTDSVELASFTAIRSNRNGNPDSGVVFGGYNNSGDGGIAFDGVELVAAESTAAVVPPPAPSTEGLPNLLFLTADDLGIEALSCYGNTVIETPNLDRLAAAGALFERAYVTQASCSPSRATFFTGFYPHQTGQYGLAHRGYSVRDGVPLLPNYLNDRGYYTGVIGKIHINLNGDYRNARWREKLGFDYFGEGRGAFDVVEVNEQVEAFFAGRDDAEPYFLMVNFSDPHRHPDGEHGFFRQIQGIPADPTGPEEVDVFPYVGFRTPKLDRAAANYYNAVRRLDDGVGMVFETLRRRGVLDDTLVVFISDHGAPFTRAKVSCYEAGVRVPMMAAWPGVIPRGQRIVDLVSSIDLLPTFLAAADVAVPADLPGIDLLPRLTGGVDCIGREYLFTEFTSHAGGHFYPRRAVRDQRYKLILNVQSQRPNPLSGLGTHIEHMVDEESPAYIRNAFAIWAHPPRVELYDLYADPFEFVNLAGRPELAAVEDRLLRVLADWRTKTGDSIGEDSENPYTTPGFEE